MRASYYNTANEYGAELLRHESASARQENDILAYMTRHKGSPFTAERIEAVFGIPRTSVSRALANLTAKNQIEKSSSARWKSSFGRSCYAWRVAA
jgi:predicted ArsR family transcriptional regulator